MAHGKRKLSEQQPGARPGQMSVNSLLGFSSDSDSGDEEKSWLHAQVPPGVRDAETLDRQVSTPPSGLKATTEARHER